LKSKGTRARKLQARPGRHGHNPTQWWTSQREARAADARRAERATTTAQARIDALRRQAARSQRDQRAARRDARRTTRAERDEARAQRDQARAELKELRAQLPAREEAFRQPQEQLSRASSEARARLAEIDTQSDVSALNAASDTTQPRATNSTHLRGYRLPRFQRAR
jgi:chromosome segregation ATPase